MISRLKRAALLGIVALNLYTDRGADEPTRLATYINNVPKAVSAFLRAFRTAEVKDRVMTFSDSAYAEVVPAKRRKRKLKWGRRKSPTNPIADKALGERSPLRRAANLGSVQCNRPLEDF